MAVQLPDATRVTNVYTPLGQIQQTYGSRQYPVGYGYDARGRMTSMTNWSNFATATGPRVGKGKEWWIGRKVSRGAGQERDRSVMGRGQASDTAMGAVWQSGGWRALSGLVVGQWRFPGRSPGLLLGRTFSAGDSAAGLGCHSIRGHEFRDVFISCQFAAGEPNCLAEQQRHTDDDDQNIRLSEPVDADRFDAFRIPGDFVRVCVQQGQSAHISNECGWDVLVVWV